MGKTLGLDLGTNSIGWAITNDQEIIDCGVRIFPAAAENIGTTKESLQNSVRREMRQMRRQVFRRKLRKVKMLEALIQYRMCPLSFDELDEWKKRIKGKVSRFPNTPAFKEWLKQNPLYLRDKATRENVTRMELGRIFYHLIQKRGFLSNRKNAKDSGAMYSGKINDGIVGISKTQTELQDFATLGSFLYHISKKEREAFFLQEERVRGRYTLREWYINEFEVIWERQAAQLGLENERAIRKRKTFLGNKETRRAKQKLEYLEQSGKTFRIEEKYIVTEETVSLKDYLGNEKFGILFYQRPLRSQKNLLSVCSFEHRNVSVEKKGIMRNRVVGKKVCSVSHPDFEKYRVYKFLNTIRYGADVPLTEEERRIAADYLFSRKTVILFKKLAEKLELTFEKFNYAEDYKVFASPYTATVQPCVSAAIWNDPKKYEDLWHVLYFYDDADRLREKLKQDFDVKEKDLDELIKFSMPEDYANLSKKAIRNILEFLEQGIPEHIAVLLGGVKNAIGSKTWQEIDSTKKSEVIEDVKRMALQKREAGQLVKVLADFLHEKFKLEYNRIYSHLYHHSENISMSGKVVEKKLEELENLRNPIVQQTLNEMRRLVNTLIQQYLGDGEHFECIKVELARELKLPKERRMNIFNDNKEREKDNQRACEELDNYGCAHTRENIHKYLLWEELKRANGTAVCPYTGKTIGIGELLGRDNLFQIEHIIPYSISLDDSLANKTICDAKENNDKGNKTPYQFYKDTPEKWEMIKERAFKLLPYQKAKRFVSTADYKQDDFIQRQLNDTRYISVKAVEYLSTICGNVISFPGSLTADLRQKWGMNRLIHDRISVDMASFPVVVTGECWAEFGDAQDKTKITHLYPRRNRKPVSGFSELILSGEVQGKNFTLNQKNFQQKKEQIPLTMNLEDGKYFVCAKIVPSILKMVPVYCPAPEKASDQILLLGNVEKNIFSNRLIKSLAVNVSWSNKMACYCLLRIDSERKVEYSGKNKFKDTKDSVVLYGEVKDGVFRVKSKNDDGLSMVLAEKVALSDGKYFACVPYRKDEIDILPREFPKPEAGERQILLRGDVRNKMFSPYMNPEVHMNTEHPDGIYWCVCALSGEFSHYVRKENLPPKVDKSVSLEEGEVRQDFETGEYYFYAKKNRGDHRHHAVDAITIAFAKREHLKILSTFNANCMLRRNQDSRVSKKLNFELPWDDFWQDAQSAVEKIIISHKFQNRTINTVVKRCVKNGEAFIGKGVAARGQLHKETVFGQHLHPKKDENGKFLTDEHGKIITEKEVFYHIRKKLIELKEKKQLEKIVDDRIRTLVMEAVEKAGGFSQSGDVPKGALFEEDPKTNVLKTKIFLPNHRGAPIPVNKVRISENQSNARCAKPSFSENDSVYNQYVNPMKNHHVIIYRTKSGELAEQVVQFWDVVQRRQKGEKLYQLPKDGVEIVTTMEINEMFLLGLEGSPEEVMQNRIEVLSEHLYRVQNLSSKDYTFRHHLEAGTDSAGKIRISSFSGFERMNPIKVNVSITGKISLC